MYRIEIKQITYTVILFGLLSFKSYLDNIKNLVETVSNPFF